MILKRTCGWSLCGFLFIGFGDLAKKKKKKEKEKCFVLVLLRNLVY